MKKVFTFIMAAFMMAFMQISPVGTAEAANVAVVPIQIDDAQVERASDLNNYYWDMLVEKFQYPEYELIADEKVADVIPDTGLTAFDQAALMDLNTKLDADIVIAMRIDKVTETPKPFLREPALQCVMKGEFASYNRLTGNYYRKKINYSEQIEEVLTLRNDWQQNAFADFLRRGINRTIEDKNKKVKF